MQVEYTIAPDVFVFRQPQRLRERQPAIVAVFVGDNNAIGVGFATECFSVALFLKRVKCESSRILGGSCRQAKPPKGVAQV